MIKTTVLALSALLLGTLSAIPQSYSGNNRATATAEYGNVLRQFQGVTRALCGGMSDRAYEVDCLADYFEWLADNLPASRDLAEARAILRDAAKRLNRVARDNASSTQRPAVLRLNTGVATSRAVLPVAPARQPTARAAARAIVEETRTVLLRAAEQSERRRVAFTDIAQAVGSTTRILLRSA